MLPKHIATVAEIAPILRGAVAIERNAMAGTVKRQILCFRSSPAILNYVNGADLARYSQVGVVTPDHTIRTKNWPLIVPAPERQAPATSVVRRWLPTRGGSVQGAGRQPGGPRTALCVLHRTRSGAARGV
jgi:rhamnose utilization protein RhaD (predicted bifunctional aldolase and dehydrogenase)